MVAVGIMLLVASVLLFVILMTVVLPRMVLKASCKIKDPQGRGTRRVIYKGQRCVVYEASNKIHKYIKQYLLLKEPEGKILKCKTSGEYSYLDYDVVVFNRYNEVIKVINVKENIPEGDFTRKTPLPDDTSYVNIVVRRADNKVVSTEPIMSVSGKRVLLYSLFALLLTLAEMFVLKVSCAYAFGGVFRESFIRSIDGAIAGSVLAILIGIASMIIVFATVSSRSKR